MKIQYKFASETIAIEVSDEWGEILIDLDRQEYNNDHKETRRHYHMEGCVYEGEDFAVEDPALARLLEDDGLLAKLPSAVASLLPRQRRLINKQRSQPTTNWYRAFANWRAHKSASARRSRKSKTTSTPSAVFFSSSDSLDESTRIRVEFFCGTSRATLLTQSQRRVTKNERNSSGFAETAQRIL